MMELHRVKKLVNYCPVTPSLVLLPFRNVMQYCIGTLMDVLTAAMIRLHLTKFGGLLTSTVPPEFMQINCVQQT